MLKVRLYFSHRRSRRQRWHFAGGSVAGDLLSADPVPVHALPALSGPVPPPLLTGRLPLPAARQSAQLTFVLRSETQID